MVNRTQALTIAVVIGFLVLGVVGVVVLAFFPYDTVFAPTPTVTSTPTVTLTPTFQSFLPTARSITPTQEPPTPANTRLPTLTPSPTGTTTPTRAPFTPTLIIATYTPTISPTITPLRPPTRTSREYSFSFEADDTTLERGRCTVLRWQSSGPITLQLDNQPVAASGEERVCPRNTTTYTMKFKVAGSAEVQSQDIKVEVE